MKSIKTKIVLLFMVLFLVSFLGLTVLLYTGRLNHQDGSNE